MNVGPLASTRVLEVGAGRHARLHPLGVPAAVRNLPEILELTPESRISVGDSCVLGNATPVPRYQPEYQHPRRLCEHGGLVREQGGV